MTLNKCKPVYQYLCILLLLSIPNLTISQELKNAVYFGQDYFLLEGTGIPDSLKENRYDRLPLSYKEIVREEVWDLSKNSAGLSIRFHSNSTSLSVKWTVLNDFKMNHMPETGIKGVDLYFKNNGNWQYLNTGRPEGFENESLLMKNMTSEMREFKMFLPLYDGLVNIEIGIDSTSIIKKSLKNKSKPIVFYGTSITQGGCASRPGMAHTNIISRKLDVDCINFGFSGNGRMEQPIAEVIAELDPAFYVIECLPNILTAEEITEKTIPLVKTIREKRPETPIIFVENFIYEPAALDKEINDHINTINTTIKNEYIKMMEGGFEHIFYISSENATGDDHEGTVDGAHFTDLGFIRYANFLINKFVQIGIINEN